MQLKHGRITLREFSEEDFELLYSIFSNEKIMRYAFWDKFETKEALIPYFDEILANNKEVEDRKAYEFAVYHDLTNEFIGIADIVIKRKNKHGGIAEIGYFLLEKFWGKGYATEMANALLDICFKDVKLHRVTATCHAGNSSSENIMKKIGMKKEGCLRKARFKNDVWVDELRYSVLYDEWKTSKK